MEQRCDAAVAAFEKQARETIDAIAKSAEGGSRKSVERAMREVSRTRREFKEEVQSGALAAPVVSAKAPPPAMPRIEEGSRVRLNGLREPARVMRKLSDDRIEVQAGVMKMQVSVDDVMEVLPAAGETSSPLPPGVSYQPSGPTWNVTYRELNVIGKRAEEAVDEVDKFLDTAAMASVDRVRIVHGHGMGILRKAIADLLTANPHVAQFYAAPPSEGGTGATVVELK
jgi:DNA mismatch repair protein MutS2